jgi:hypothetical protein
VWRKGALAIGAGTAAALAVVGSALMSEELATKKAGMNEWMNESVTVSVDVVIIAKIN